MAKIYGQLERAQLENLGSDPANTIPGRIWWDTVNGLGKIATGSSIKVLVDTDTAQTLTNKTISASSNTLTNIVDACIGAGAAIAWSKLSKSGSNLNEIATRSHTVLSDIGTNSHVQIDSHIASTSNPHSTTANQIGANNIITEVNNNGSGTFNWARMAALTADRVLVSSAGGLVTASTVTTTKLGYLDVSSSLTTLLAAKAPLANPSFTGTVAMEGLYATGAGTVLGTFDAGVTTVNSSVADNGYIKLSLDVKSAGSHSILASNGTNLKTLNLEGTAVDFWTGAASGNATTRRGGWAADGTFSVVGGATVGGTLGVTGPTAISVTRTAYDQINIGLVDPSGAQKGFGFYDYTATAYRMFIAETGNVGLGGNVQPAKTLDITGTLGVSGLATLAGGVSITGGTFAASKIYADATSGLVIAGRTGSSNDLTIGTPAGAGIITVPTGTNNVNMPGSATIGGTLGVTGAIAIGNTVAVAAGVASTHKVTISIGGVTYYLLATNV